MKLTITRDPVARRTTYTLVIDDLDAVGVHFTPMDNAVLHDCDQPDASIADALLALELIARRIEEGNARMAAHPLAVSTNGHKGV